MSPPSDSLGYQPVKEEWLTWWSFKAFKLNTLPRFSTIPLFRALAPALPTYSGSGIAATPHSSLVLQQGPAVGRPFCYIQSH